MFIITGSTGLIGSSTSEYWRRQHDLSIVDIEIVDIHIADVNIHDISETRNDGSSTSEYLFSW